MDEETDSEKLRRFPHDIRVIDRLLDASHVAHDKSISGTVLLFCSERQDPDGGRDAVREIPGVVSGGAGKQA